MSEYFPFETALDVPTIGVGQQGGRRRFYSIAGVTPQLATDDNGAANNDDWNVVKSALVILIATAPHFPISIVHHFLLLILDGGV